MPATVPLPALGRNSYPADAYPRPAFVHSRPSYPADASSKAIRSLIGCVTRVRGTTPFRGTRVRISVTRVRTACGCRRGPGQRRGRRRTSPGYELRPELPPRPEAEDPRG